MDGLGKGSHAPYPVPEPSKYYKSTYMAKPSTPSPKKHKVTSRKVDVKDEDEAFESMTPTKAKKVVVKEQHDDDSDYYPTHTEQKNMRKRKRQAEGESSDDRKNKRAKR